MLRTTGVGRVPAPDETLLPRYVHGKNVKLQKMDLLQQVCKGVYKHVSKGVHKHACKGVYKPVAGRKVCEKSNICRGKHVASKMRFFWTTPAWNLNILTSHTL